MSTSHIVHLKITHMMEMTMLHITDIGDGKITDTTIMQHHFNHYIQTVISKTFTTGGQLGKVISFITPVHVSIPMMSFMNKTLVKITDNHHKMLCPKFQRQITSLSYGRANNITDSLYINGTRSKSEAWMEAIENAAQISGQNAMHTDFAN